MPAQSPHLRFDQCAVWVGTMAGTSSTSWWWGSRSSKPSWSAPTQSHCRVIGGRCFLWARYPCSAAVMEVIEATLVCLSSSSSLLLSSLDLSHTKVYQPLIRALLGTASHFCGVVHKSMSSSVRPNLGQSPFKC